MTGNDEVVNAFAPAWRGRAYAGERTWLIDVVVTGGPDGAVTYHIILADGSPPTSLPGAAPGGAQATLEQSWKDAVAQASGDENPVVAYMRGTTKTKGGTRPLYELFRLLQPL